MPKKLAPLAFAGITLTPLLTIADSSRADNTREGAEPEIVSDRDNGRETRIQPKDVAAASPPESLDVKEQFSTPARTLEDAPWLLDSMTPTVEFSESRDGQSDLPAPSSTASPETTPIEFTPRFGASYGTSDGGVGALSSISGFLPLQTSPYDLFFLEGNWRFEDGNSDRLEGISAVLGYRTFASKGDRVWGGYVAYDKRTTNFSVFHQLGLGFETLGDVDFRVNGYIPLGQSRNLYGTNSFESITRTSDLYFRDRYLSYDTLRISGENRFYEVALGGLDAELGVKLLSFGRPDNDLRLYGGTYYYSGEGIAPTWGWRARLEARPTDVLNIGLSLQQDDLFGTNLVFNIGANFPSHRRKRKLKDNETNLPRLADTVRRNSTIATTSDTESELTVREEQVLAKNPETGEPWVFRHVTLGATGGDGTFENPFGTVQDGLDTSVSDGNYIVYVDIGANPDIPGFSIPDRVQVLSRGPVQSLDTIQFGTLQIPLSGTGQYPTVRGTTTATGPLTGMVALGNYSTLSGFEIQADGNNGIIGHNIVKAIARDNRIFNGDRGVYLQGDGATSSLTLLRAEISDMMQQGIFLEALNGGAIAETTITDVQIANSDRGVHLHGDNAAGNVDIVNISINDIVQQAIFLEALHGGVAEATVTNAQIANSDRGIHLSGDQATSRINVSDISINNTTQQAVFLESGNEGATEATVTNAQIANSDRGIHLSGDQATSRINVSDVSIDSTMQQAILLEAANEGVAEASVADVQIANSDRGLHLQGDQATGRVDVARVTISETLQQAILLEATNEGEAEATIEDVQIANSDRGLHLQGDQATGRVDVARVTISETLQQAILLEAANKGEAEATIADVKITNSDRGIHLQGDQATGHLNVSDVSINNTTQQAIFLEVLNSGEISNSSIANIQILNADRGIHLLGDSGVGSINITNAFVNNNTREGILLEAIQGGEIAPSTVRDSIISDAASGLALLVDNGTGSVNLLNNSISNITNNGISLNLSNGGILQDITSQNNQIENVGNGIVLQADSGTVENTNVSGNSIQNANDIGILFSVNENTLLDRTNISGNTLSATPKEGILIWSDENSDISNLVISDNKIQDIFVFEKSSPSDGIELRIQNGSTAENVIISNNILDRISDDGIAITTRGTSKGDSIDGLTIANNIISDAGFNSDSGCGAGIEIANNDNTNRRISNINLLNNQMIRSTHGSIVFDSKISFARGTNDGGYFGVTNLSGNSSIDPKSGVDLLLRLGNSASFDFLSLGNINTVNQNVVNLDTEIANFTNLIGSNPNFDLNIRRKKNCPAL
ncbi:MAG: right-handed parallel beta-helix repeat-containing protein [Cyanobacteria bacterium SBLK]|nr:right-handed parallel beta-helix repeat-containing protein [Cyanobacteria bacterium SBLK]